MMDFKVQIVLAQEDSRKNMYSILVFYTFKRRSSHGNVKNITHNPMFWPLQQKSSA